MVGLEPGFAQSVHFWTLGSAGMGVKPETEGGGLVQL